MCFSHPHLKNINNLVCNIIFSRVYIYQFVVAKAFEVAEIISSNDLIETFLKPVDYIYDEEQYVSHCESTEVAIEKPLGLRVLPGVHHQQGEAVADNSNNRHDIAAAAENKLVHNIRHWTRECVTKCCVSRRIEGRDKG